MVHTEISEPREEKTRYATPLSPKNIAMIGSGRKK
jgi:hypothetical protein